MRITPEQAAQAVARWIGQADPEEVAAVFEATFAVVGTAVLCEDGMIDVEIATGFTEDDFGEEIGLNETPIPGLHEWPESLTDEILDDYGISFETLRESDDPVALVVAAGMDEDTLRERIEGDRIRTEKRCAD